MGIPVSEVLIPVDLKIEVFLRKPSSIQPEPQAQKPLVSPKSTKQKSLPKATEITKITLEESDNAFIVQIKGNGAMTPKVFSLDNNRIVMVFPKTAINAQLPSRVVPHLKDPWLGAAATKPVPVKLLHNLTTPLLPQIIEGLESPVHEVAVVSPFFDDEPKLLDWVHKNAKPRAVTIFTQNSAPGLTPAWCEHPTLKSKTHRLLFSHWGEEGRTRQLHAKAVGISHGKSTRLAFGSANFTRAALLATPEDGNVEVVLALDDVPRKSIQVHGLFDPSGLAHEAEYEAILRAASASQGNLTKMAEMLGIGRTTLRRKIKASNIRVEDFRRPAGVRK